MAATGLVLKEFLIMVSEAGGLPCGSRTNVLPFGLSNDSVVLRLTIHLSGKREQWEWRVPID